MILFLKFFILQRFMNITLEIAMQLHRAGIKFIMMEAAKLERVFPERNGARNPDESFIGWNIPKFHIVIHKAMAMDGRKTSVQKELSVHTRYVIYLVYLSPT